MQVRLVEAVLSACDGLRQRLQSAALRLAWLGVATLGLAIAPTHAPAQAAAKDLSAPARATVGQTIYQAWRRWRRSSV